MHGADLALGREAGRNEAGSRPRKGPEVVKDSLTGRPVGQTGHEHGVQLSGASGGSPS